MNDVIDIHSIRTSLERILPQISSFFSKRSVNNFLGDTKVEKSLTQRLISWLIYIRLIPDSIEKFIPQVLSLCLNYYSYLVEYNIVNDKKSPLLKLDPIEASDISNDTLRTIVWYSENKKSYYEHFQLQMNDDEKKALFCVNRIFTVYYLTENENFAYFQGYERFAFIAYFLSNEFVQKYNLSPFLSEVFCSFLTKSIIHLSFIKELINYGSNSVGHFSQIDEKINVFFPEIYSILKANGNGSQHFVMRWELLLFADEHDIYNLLLILDHLLLRYYDDVERKKIMECLVLSHINQVANNIKDVHFISGNSLVKLLQNFKDWNVEKIVEDAEFYFSTLI